MENDWEILDNYEWVSKWFVWLRIFNNLINMIIWTFWTCSFLYTVWLFFLTKQMNFLGYYVFLYSMYLNVFGLVFLDDYLYFLDRYLRDEQRRIRIEKLRKEDERIQTVGNLKLLSKTSISLVLLLDTPPYLVTVSFNPR